MEGCGTVALSTIAGNGVDTVSVDGFQTVRSNTGIGRRSFSRIPTVWEMPDLVQVQIESFDWFKREGLRELLEEISPISDHHKKMELTFGEYRFDEPWKRLPDDMQAQGKADPRVVEQFCRERDITYAAPLRIKARLRVVNPETGEIREIGAGDDEDSEIFIGDFPLMTTDGTFIINGAERVVVSQLVRSPGVYFDRSPDPTTGKLVSSAKLIPNRGAWLEFETSNRDVISVKVDRKRKMPVTILLRAIGMTDEELEMAFADVDTNPDRAYLRTTLEKDPTKQKDDALIELYRRLRPGDPPTRDNATSMLEN
jgi:DNA-directed RNA polymerase subunit beta